MIELSEQVERTIAEQRLFQPGESILVAVSGGLDSMVLLDILQRLAGRHQWRLVVAHFNHQLRGKESDADADLVRRTSTRLGLEFVTERWPVAARSRARRHGLEMAARLARHDFLARAARARKIRAIALAHHADDQVELFFLRLFRGAGGEGLAGMKWESPGLASVSGGRRARLVRPFLTLSKIDLARHAQAQRVRFRDDSSNASPDHARNRVRLELLPLLTRRFESAIARMVLRTMDLTGIDADFARGTAERWLAKPGRVRFERLHAAVQRQCLRLQLVKLDIPPTYDLVEHLRRHPRRAINASEDCRVLRDDHGRLSCHRGGRNEFSPQEMVIDLDRQGSCRFDGAEVDWEPQAVQGGYRRTTPRPGREYFDADQVGSTVMLRHWRKGDRFQPIGLGQEVKLQDLFTNLKIPRARRHQLLVAVTEEGRIWWVEDLRIGERFKVGAQTKRRLAWHWRRRGNGTVKGVG